MPLGYPGEPDVHFCGKPVDPGSPSCVDQRGQCYQAQLPPPALLFGRPRVR